jgi:hypothetical protein
MKNTKVILLSERLYSDVLLLPSYFAGLFNALLEAMAYGLAPMVTSAGSIQKSFLMARMALLYRLKATNQFQKE